MVPLLVQLPLLKYAHFWTLVRTDERWCQGLHVSVIELAAMPSLRTLDDAARQAKVSRRLLQVWLASGALKRWQVPGDRHRFVDLDEVKRLMQPRVVEPRPLPPKRKRKP
jgi:hypothetical protein